MRGRPKPHINPCALFCTQSPGLCARSRSYNPPVLPPYVWCSNSSVHAALCGTDEGKSMHESQRSQSHVLRVLRESIRLRRTVTIDFRGFRRLVSPHRLWRRVRGEFLLEGRQLGGGSAWGAMGAFEESLLGGYQGWINFPIEEIESIETNTGEFVPEPDFNPSPTRMLGEIDTQVEVLGRARPGTDETSGTPRTEGFLSRLRRDLDAIARGIERLARRVADRIRRRAGP